MSLLDEADDIGRVPQPGRGLIILRAFFKRCKDVLEGHVPPHAIIDEEAKQAVRDLRGHVAHLDGAAGVLGNELIRRQITELRTDLALRRRQQRNRHSAARRRKRTSPLEVRRFVIQHEFREGEARGAAAAAARHFGETRHQISRLLQQADQQRVSLLMLYITTEGVEQMLAEDVRAGSAAGSDREAATRLRVDIKKLLRKLPPRR